ncbi:MAG: aminotransferase class III-fold pyridoxal phosphate-dependent enzyme, partial [Bacteroidales bacterium]|nr:aminotransferase class III-fold pyridoxal phosphate-dependent enzyme [Bacteroidales bacterium]
MITSVNDFRELVAQVGEIDEIMIDVEKAEGIYVWDTSGKRYMDMLSGICVGNIGHRNPKVIDAVKEQLDKYMHVMVYGEFVQSPQYKYMKRLKEFLPESLSQIFYVNSGSEAIEGAMKAAKLFTGRSEILSCQGAYHGSTTGAVALLSQEEFTRKFRPLMPDCNKIEYNNFEDLERITERTACLIVEP